MSTGQGSSQLSGEESNYHNGSAKHQSPDPRDTDSQASVSPTTGRLSKNDDLVENSGASPSLTSELMLVTSLAADGWDDDQEKDSDFGSSQKKTDTELEGDQRSGLDAEPEDSGYGDGAMTGMKKLGEKVEIKFATHEGLKGPEDDSAMAAMEKLDNKIESLRESTGDAFKELGYDIADCFANASKKFDRKFATCQQLEETEGRLTQAIDRKADREQVSQLAGAVGDNATRLDDQSGDIKKILETQKSQAKDIADLKSDRESDSRAQQEVASKLEDIVEKKADRAEVEKKADRAEVEKLKVHFNNFGVRLSNLEMTARFDTAEARKGIKDAKEKLAGLYKLIKITYEQKLNTDQAVSVANTVAENREVFEMQYTEMRRRVQVLENAVQQPELPPPYPEDPPPTVSDDISRLPQPPLSAEGPQPSESDEALCRELEDMDIN